jgi:hypothetical protein
VDLLAVDYFLRLGSPADLAYNRIHPLPVGPVWSASSSVSETHQRDYRNLRNVLALIKYRNSAYSPASSVFGT